MCQGLEAAVLVLCSLVVSTAQGDAKGLVSADETQRKAISAEILKHRMETIHGLIDIVSGRKMREENRSAVVAAIDLLGELRAQEAVPALANLLLYGREKDFEYRQDGAIRSLVDQRKGFPAIDALVKIGIPALGLMAKIVAEPPMENLDRFKIAHCRLVITGVLGNQLAAEFLRIKSTETHLPSQKKMLLEVRESILRTDAAMKRNVPQE